MKNKLYIFFAGIMFFAILQSCKKDNSEISVQLNEIGISGIEDKYTVLSTDTLIINPVLSASIQADFNERNYDFHWINMGGTSVTSTSQDTLARTKNLSAVLALKTGAYKMIFKMVDKRTGIFSAKVFLVNVSSKFSSGFLLLSDVGEGSRLDMLAKTNTGYDVVTDVFAKSGSSFVLKGKPYFVSSIDDPFDGNKTFIGTSEGTNMVAEETFAEIPSGNIVYQFKGSTLSAATFKPTMLYQGPYWTAFLYHEHDIYVSNLLGSPFSTPINNVGEHNAAFRASPFIANYLTSSYSSRAIIFDDQNQTFYNYSGGLGVSAMSAGNLYNFNVKKQLVYMGFSLYNAGEVFAVLKDNNQPVYHFTRFSASYKKIAFAYQYTYQVMTAVDIDKATLFAATPLQGYLFYAVGGKLYSYDYSSNSSKLMKDYGSRKISMLKVNLPETYWVSEEYSDMLMVATYDEHNLSTSGSIEFFKTTPVQGNLILYSSYAGMGKVVSALIKY